MALGDEESASAHEIIHELRNALGLVINYATLVARDLDGRPDLAEDVEEIRNAGRLAADLVAQLARVITPDQP